MMVVLEQDEPPWTAGHIPAWVSRHFRRLGRNVASVGGVSGRDLAKFLKGVLDHYPEAWVLDFEAPEFGRIEEDDWLVQVSLDHRAWFDSGGQPPGPFLPVFWQCKSRTAASSRKLSRSAYL